MGRRRSVIVLTILAFVVVTSGVALAQESRLDGKVRFGDSVSIGANETVDGNLYAFGGEVSVAGSVTGDLIVWAGQVTIDGNVGGDVLVASGRVSISGDIDGDVRTAAGTTDVTGPVGGDLSVASGQLNIGGNATVGNDLLFASGQATMRGTVDGDVLGSAGSYISTGAVAGTEDVTLGEPPEEPSFADRALSALSRFVSIVLVAALLLWLLPRLFDRVVQIATERPLPSLGWGALGFLGIIVFFVATLIAAILLTLLFALLTLGPLVVATWLTLVASWAAVGFSIYAIGAFVAPTVAGGLAGYLMFRAEDRSWPQRVGAVSVGLVVVVVLTSLGWIGSLIGLVIFVAAVGALILVARGRSSSDTAGATAGAASLE